jgi:CRP-like cAMP-binding protein
LEIVHYESGVEPVGGWCVPRGWTHEALAQAVGARRETVTRALRDLESHGYLRRAGQHVVVGHPQRLARDFGTEPM